MIVWGGYSYDGTDHYWNTGGRYNPMADTWSATTVTNAPVGREYHTAVWTGSEMVIWGGSYADPFPVGLNTGGKYNPGADIWTATTTTDAPSPRDSHSAVWTGSEMIIWDGLFDQSRGQIQSRNGQLDRYKHNQCAEWPGHPHGSVDWQ